MTSLASPVILRETDEVKVRRLVLLTTALVVAGLGTTFALLQWDASSRLATVLSALAAIASIGVAVWAALPGTGHRLHVAHTGAASAAAGGRANSGVIATAATTGCGIDVSHTGQAQASDGGNANTGVQSAVDAD